MDGHNHYYGHSAILAARAGLAKPAHMNALLQHGWTSESPVRAHFGNVPAAAARHLLVWSHRSRAWSPAEERPTQAIGAPWLYLLDELGATDRDHPDDPVDPSSRVVGFPFHSNETMQVEGSLRELAEHWRTVHGPMTICLYFTEVRDAGTVQAYVAAGHRVVTLGDRWDPEFLLRLYGLLQGAELVVSNRLSTSVFYAASMGIGTRVHGDPMRAPWVPEDRYEAIRSRWPEFHGDLVDAPAQRAVADDELGRAHLRSGAELRELLQWPARGPRAFYYYWVGSPIVTFRTALRERRAAGPAAHPEPPAQESPGIVDRLAGMARASYAYYPRPLPSLPVLDPREPLPVRP